MKSELLYSNVVHPERAENCWNHKGHDWVDHTIKGVKDLFGKGSHLATEKAMCRHCEATRIQTWITEVWYEAKETT